GTTERTSTNPAERASALSGGTSAWARAPQLVAHTTRTSAASNRAGVTALLSATDSLTPIDGCAALPDLLHSGRDLSGNRVLIVFHCLGQRFGFRDNLLEQVPVVFDHRNGRVSDGDHR